MLVEALSVVEEVLAEVAVVRGCYIVKVVLWDILYFPLLGLRGSYLLIFSKASKAPPSFGDFGEFSGVRGLVMAFLCGCCCRHLETLESKVQPQNPQEPAYIGAYIITNAILEVPYIL